MSRIAALLLFILFLVPWLSASAQTCSTYVNATDGDDSNSGSITSPLRSVEFAYTSVPANSEICIAAGEYFYGDDSDGISFSIPGKGMSFILNSFAGETEIRFSEARFEIDVGTAQIEFRAGSSANLVLGEGVANVDDPGAPELLNFIHSVLLTSGSFDISTVSLTLEASTGNPAFVNPLNAQKTAPSTSRIEFGDVDIVGAFLYENAPRTYAFTPQADRLLDFPLPPTLSLNRYSFENAGVLTVQNEVLFDESPVFFDNTGPIRFIQEVSINPEGGSLSVRSAGDVRFENSVTFQGDSAPEFLIHHSGSGTVRADQLNLLYQGESGDVGSTILIDGDGVFSAGLVVQQASGAGFNYLVDVEVAQGRLELGVNGSDFRLPGALINRGRVMLGSSIELSQDPLGLSMLNEGSVNLASHFLRDNGVGNTIVNNGAIVSEGDNGVENSGSSSWSGLGSISNLLVQGDILLADELSITGQLTVDQNASFSVDNDASIVVGGDVSARDGSSMTLGPNSKLDVTGSITFTTGTAELSPSSELVVGNTIDLSSVSLPQLNGLISFTGAGFRTILGDAPLSLPNVNIDGSDVRLGVPSSIQGLNISAGGLAIEGNAAVTFHGNVAIDAGYLRTPSASVVEFLGPVEISNGVGNFIGASSLRFGSDFEWASGTISVPGSGITLFGDQPATLVPSDGFVLPFLSIEGNETDITIDGSLTLNSDLILADGFLGIGAGSILTINGDMIGIGGVLKNIPGGAVTIAGSGPRTISGFEQSMLPALMIEGPDVSFTGFQSLIRRVVFAGGSLRVTAGSTLTIDDIFELDSGDLFLDPGATLRFNSATAFTSGAATLGSGTAFVFAGDVNLLSTRLDAPGASFLFNGGTTQIVDFQQDIDIKRVRSTGFGTSVVWSGKGTMTVSESIEVEAGTSLDIGSSTVLLSGAGDSPSFMVDGVTRASGGAFQFSGPANVNSDFTLSGSGIFGSIVVDLADDTDHLLVSGSSASFRFSGNIFFKSGSINAAGKTVEPSGSQAIPGIEISLSDQIGQPGRIDGGRFFDSTGPLDFNPIATPFNLTYSGSLKNIYVIGPEFQPNAIRNLEIFATDQLNDPQLFGVQLKDDASISGSLRIADNARLTLNGIDLELQQSNVTHTIDGDLLGSGLLVISGDGSILGSPAASGHVEKLTVNNLSEQNPVVVSGIRSISRLHMAGGSMRIAPPLPGTPQMLISEALTGSGGNLLTSRPLQIGDGEEAAVLAFSGGALRINGEVDITIGNGSTVNVSGSSSVSIDSIDPGSSKGFLVFEGEGFLSASNPIPRLRLSANHQNLISDDLHLVGDTRVNDVFEIEAGDLLFGTHELWIQGGRLSVKEPEMPLDGTDAFFGMDAANPGRLFVSGTSTIELSRDLELIAVQLSVGDSADDRVSVVSTGGAPVSIRLDSQALAVTSGTFDLGLTDIILSGTTPGLLTLGPDGQILAASSPAAPAKGSGSRTTAAIQFPVEDSQFGEVILNGAGNAGILTNSLAPIPNLTIDGTTRLSPASNPLRISGRLAFGRNGAIFILGAAQRLIMLDHSIFVRRGIGTLSHAPSIDGDYDVFYDLDDGSYSGVDSEFGPGALSSGLELAANPIAIRNLGILAGSRGGFSNTVVIDANVAVSSGLSLFSGDVDLGNGSITLDSGASFSIDEVDPLAPVNLRPAFSYGSKGPVNVNLIYRHRDVFLADDVLPPQVPIDSLYVRLGNQPEGTDVSLHLARDLTVGTGSVNGFGTESRLELDGRSLLIAGSMELNDAQINSVDAASILVGTTFTSNTVSSILGTVDLSVTGDVSISGSFLGSELTVSGNLVLLGFIGPHVHIRFTGAEQEFSASGPVTVRDLTLAQLPAPGSDFGRLILVEAPDPFDIEIMNQLVLQNGVMDTRINRIVLPGSSAGYSRTAAAPIQSHIFGNIVRRAPSLSQESYVFPTGDFRSYRPLTLTFSDPNSLDTEIIVSQVGARPFGSVGLPLNVGGGLILNSILEFAWTVRSTTTLPLSQAYAISLSTEADGISIPEGLRLLSRTGGYVANPWAAVTNENSVEVIGDRIQITAREIRGLLGPVAKPLVIGSPEMLSAMAEFQVINALDLEDGGDLSIDVSGVNILSQSHTNSASPVYPVQLSGDGTEQRTVSIASPGTGLNLERVIGLTPDSRTTIVAGRNSNGIPDLVSLTTSVEAILEPNQMAVGFINASPDLPVERIILSGSLPALFENATGLSIFEPVVLAPQNLEIHYDQSVVLDAFVYFRFDYTGFDRQLSFLLQSGFLNPPETFVNPSPAQLWVVLEDGAFLAVVDVTDIEDSDDPAETPAEFRLLGNYPNPFNPQTTIVFDLPTPADISLVVVDLLGRQVSRVEPGRVEAGKARTLGFDASNLASGTYLYRLQINTGKALQYRTGKMVVIK